MYFLNKMRSLARSTARPSKSSATRVNATRVGASTCSSELQRRRLEQHRSSSEQLRSSSEHERSRSTPNAPGIIYRRGCSPPPRTFSFPPVSAVYVFEAFFHLVEFLFEPRLAGNQQPDEYENNDECEGIRNEEISHWRGSRVRDTRRLLRLWRSPCAGPEDNYTGLQTSGKKRSSPSTYPSRVRRP